MVLTQEQHKFYQASLDLQKVDLTITSTIATDTRIELFNFLFSNTKVYNSACNASYYPVTLSAYKTFPASNTTNGFTGGYLMGFVDDFVDANSPFANPGSTNGVIFFNNSGALTYQPGIASGTQTTGTLTVQSRQTNYRHCFETLGAAAIYVRNIKVQVGTTYTNQLNEDFKFVSQNITSSAGSNNQGASTYSNEYQYQNNIVTCPINQAIDPNGGLWYNIKAYDTVNTNTITLSIFFVPMTKNML